MILLFQIYIHLLESWHDFHVIKGSDKNEHYHNSKWHKWDSLIWLSVHTFIAVTQNDIVYIATGLIVRLFMLQVVLNKLRGLPITHLGKGTIDSFCNLYLGKRLTLILKVAIFMGCFLYEILK